MEVNGMFTITQEECDQLDKEYLINDCIYYLMKSRSLVGGNKTIDEAIEELKTQTRFADEVQEIYNKNLGGLVQDFFDSFSV
jgi:hypothetical protein